MRALETPGHTPESVCLVLTDEERSSASNRPAMRRADRRHIFIGDVGRPDLSPTHTPQQLAGLLYDSLHQKLLALPDAVLVYPAHGAGSLCGRAMRAEKSSTIGTERLTNYALQIASREEFIRQLTTNLPTRPDYFLEDAEINRSGAPTLDRIAAAARAVSRRCGGFVAAECLVCSMFVPATSSPQAHVPGSIGIALSGQFASWAGGILGIHANPVLVARQRCADRRSAVAAGARGH